MAARVVTRLDDESLAPCRLQSTQLTVLWATAAFEAASVRSITRTVLMDQSTLIRNLRLTPGIKNVLNTNPPFALTGGKVSFQAVYDPQ